VIDLASVVLALVKVFDLEGYYKQAFGYYKLWPVHYKKETEVVDYYIQVDYYKQEEVDYYKQAEEAGYYKQAEEADYYI